MPNDCTPPMTLIEHAARALHAIRSMLQHSQWQGAEQIADDLEASIAQARCFQLHAPAVGGVAAEAPIVPGQDRWQHIKSGGYYRLLAYATRESDLTGEVVYQSEADGRLWIRPVAQFHERFRRV